MDDRGIVFAAAAGKIYNGLFLKLFPNSIREYF